MRPQRPQNLRTRRRSLLIQCEGQKTEPNYLDGLCKACGIRHHLEVKVRAGKGQNAVVTVEAAVAEGKRKLDGLNRYDDVWCVLDVEHAAHEAKLTEALALARTKNIRMFLSNPSFEVWLIAHFQHVKRGFENGGAAEAYLNTLWQKHLHHDYEKGDPNLYAKLADKVGDALENAEWGLETFHGAASCREANASTEVYQLVRELLGHIPP